MDLELVITPTNVVIAARFILNLDNAVMSKQFVQDVYPTIYWLRYCLEQFSNPSHAQRIKGVSEIDQVEYHMRNLIEAVKSMLPYLPDDSLLQLKSRLLEELPV